MDKETDNQIMKTPLHYIIDDSDADLVNEIVQFIKFKLSDENYKEYLLEIIEKYKPCQGRRFENAIKNCCTNRQLAIITVELNLVLDAEKKLGKPITV